MGSINYGNQTISVQYFAPAQAKVVNKRFFNIVPRGIYVGGYLLKVSDTLVSLSPLVVEIGDDSHQVRIETQDSVSIPVGISTPYIILRWSYAASNINYMDILAVASESILPNDIIVGKCVYVGATLSSFDYAERSNPAVFELFLKVEPTQPASMRVRVRAGRVNYGTANYDIPDQISPVFVPPVANPRIDALYVDSDGVVKVMSGVEAATPAPPPYNNKKVLAEISLAVGQSAIEARHIKDVRSWL